MTVSRRAVLVGGGTTVIAAGIPKFASAQATNIVGISWGGPQLDGAKAISSEWAKTRSATRVAWEAHEGSSSAVATKIKATWPNVKLHMCHVNDPAIHLMGREGWLETVDDLPMMKQVHEKFVLRNAQGQALAVPHYASTVCWGYRKDLVDRPIESLSELLEPRFKGRIGFRDPNSWSGLPLVSIALEGGGGEKNIDPAFEFLAKVAKAGNIVNVGKSNADVINSLNLGESSVAIAGITEWAEVAKNHPVQLLTKVPNSKSLKAFYALVHWAIPKSPVSGAAKELANYFLDPVKETEYMKIVGAAPSVKGVQFSDPLGALVSEADLDKYAYFCDFNLMSQLAQKWTERFDVEIRPLLRRA
jgi:putative spermidine/putrescine transport system substrate-binding protein